MKHFLLITLLCAWFNIQLNPSTLIAREVEAKEHGFEEVNFYAAGTWLIKKFESYRRFPYKCAAGYWTIGFGTRIEGLEVIKYAFTGMDYHTAQERFLDDLVSVRMKIKEKYPFLPASQHWALVSLAYNCGFHKIKDTVLERHILNQDYASAGKWVLKWSHIKGRKKPLKGLLKRRQDEKLFWCDEVTNEFVSSLQCEVKDKIQRELETPKISKSLLSLRARLMHAAK